MGMGMGGGGVHSLVLMHTAPAHHMHITHTHTGYSHDKMEKIHRYFPDAGVEGHVENILQQMKELSICKSG
jgi:hypothetical protein